jgi:hypothetical protein
MLGRPATKCTPSTGIRGAQRFNAKATCSYTSRPANNSSGSALRLFAAFAFIAGSPIPASARSYFGQSPASHPLPVKTQGDIRDEGKCAVSREWSQARLLEYWPGEGHIRSVGTLGYMGKTGTAQDADLAEARAQVERVVRVSGLEMNFDMIAAPSTPAAAEIINGRRVILFDPHFMAQVADRICPDWGATSILAHEVGHHLAGHTLRQSNEPWRDELEADDFSGFVLARLGATLAEATSAAARILPEQSTQSHPGRADRITAIVHGWQNAKAMMNAEKAKTKVGQNLLPAPQKNYDPTGDYNDFSDLSLQDRIIIYDDPNDYYITKSGRIDSYNGQRTEISRKTFPSSSNYAWAFQSEGLRLNVGHNGRIYIRLPSGVTLEVGMVVPLMPRMASGE